MDDLVGKPVQSLREHIKKLFQSRQGLYGENGFDMEFNYIERKTERDLYYGDFKTAVMQCNSSKNRYSNVLPLEKTRVVLSEGPEEGSDYINASYINGQVPGSERAYICTQGPIKSTVGDLWRMVWEQHSSVIVMLTKEIENTKPKCSRYWPEPDQPVEMHGKYRVTLEHLELVGEVVIRTMRLEDTTREGGGSRIVTQYQYISWPDHGLPVSTTAFLELVRMVSKVDAHKKSGPIIVHCSAGIGRSGTFCTVHSTITKFKHDLTTNTVDVIPTFDILHTVIHMRQQRPGMVQTKEQYKFCYLSIDREASHTLFVVCIDKILIDKDAIIEKKRKRAREKEKEKKEKEKERERKRKKVEK